MSHHSSIRIRLKGDRFDKIKLKEMSNYHNTIIPSFMNHQVLMSKELHSFCSLILFRLEVICFTVWMMTGNKYRMKVRQKVKLFSINDCSIN